MPNLQADYHETLNNPKLVELREEIALMTARVQQLLSKGESGKRWKQVRAGLYDLDEALTEGDKLKLRVTQKKLRDTVNAGLRDWSHWSEIGEHVEQVRKLKASEHRHRTDTRMAITIEQLTAEIAAVLNVIAEHVKDRDTLHTINVGLREVMSRYGVGAGDSPGFN